MNSSIEVLKEIYKPYRYTIKGNATIIDSTSGSYVIKKKTNNLGKLFNYLHNRNFYNFPKLIDESRKGVNVLEYIPNNYEPIEQRELDMIKLVASLHNKTSYFKEVSHDIYKSIYDNIKSNIEYLKSYYNEYYDTFFKSIYMSPSSYIFMRNYSKLVSALDFSLKELDEWYSFVENEDKTRVVLLHNNLNINHFIKGEDDYLISWDNYKFDSPILDIINMYHNEYLNVNFKDILDTYFKLFPLLEHEKKLLFILITIPKEIKISNNNFNNCKVMQELFDYIYKTELLIRPYYTNKEKEEE